MLLMNEELWKTHKIIKFYCSDSWEQIDTNIITQSTLNRFKELLIQSYELNKESILICDCNKGANPSITQALKIGAFMVSISEQIKNGLLFTIMYAKSPDTCEWLEKLLKMYTPIRPVHIITDKKDIKKMLVENNKNLDI
jgi:hypothetical protein